MQLAHLAEYAKKTFVFRKNCEQSRKRGFPLFILFLIGCSPKKLRLEAEEEVFPSSFGF